MATIKINFVKQLDGYTFSLLPSMRDYIKKTFPDSHPANNIFIGYDIKSDFEIFVGKLENYIFPVLLGKDNQNDLKKIDEIEYVNSQTGEKYNVNPSSVYS